MQSELLDWNESKNSRRSELGETAHQKQHPLEERDRLQLLWVDPTGTILRVPVWVWPSGGDSKTFLRYPMRLWLCQWPGEARSAHARAEADSFALIAELEAAKEDADNAAAYWSDPTDAEDCRIYCEGGAPIMNDKCNSQKYSDDLPDERSTLQPIQQLPSSTPPLDENEDASPMPELAASPSGACSPQTAGSPSQRAGCYLVLEDKNQGTLTATWSRMMPT